MRLVTDLQQVGAESLLEVCLVKVKQHGGVGQLHELLAQVVLGLAQHPGGAVGLLPPGEHRHQVVHAQVLRYHILTT